jgi:hypothetical protein
MKFKEKKERIQVTNLLVAFSVSLRGLISRILTRKELVITCSHCHTCSQSHSYSQTFSAGKIG